MGNHTKSKQNSMHNYIIKCEVQLLLLRPQFIKLSVLAECGRGLDMGWGIGVH